MFRAFEGRTADEAWREIASAFREGDGTIMQASRNGPTREILHATVSVGDPRQRWVVSRTPALNVAFALAEFIWILRGRNDSAFVNYFNRALPEYCGGGSIYHGAYGHRLRRHLKIDQLERAYEVLRKNPNSRQVVLQIWDSAVDLPQTNGQPTSEDVPCNIAAMLKVRDETLEWTQIIRSNDIFRGLPYNIVQFTMLQEIIAGWLGLKLGSYNQVSDSLHLYNADSQQMELSRVTVVEPNTDSLALPRPEFDSVLSELERRSEAVTDERNDVESLMLDLERAALPPSYRNILCVLCAEGARRRGLHGRIDAILAQCTSAVYRQMYVRWLGRFHLHPSR